MQNLQQQRQNPVISLLQKVGGGWWGEAEGGGDGGAERMFPVLIRLIWLILAAATAFPELISPAKREN